MSVAYDGGASLRAELDRLSLLLEVTNLLVSRKSVTELSLALSDSIGRLIPHEYASLSLFDTPDQLGAAHVRIVVLDGIRRPDLERQAFMLGELGRTAFGRHEAMTYDLDALAAANPRVHAMIAPLGLRSLISLPLTTSRGHLGILTVGARNDDEFGPAEVQPLKDVSTQIAIAAENTLAFDEIRRLRDLLLSEKRYLEEELRERHDFREIVGQSGTLRRALQQVDTVASTDATVLLTGETGTGKELVARAIHDRSPRRAHTFVRVNCAAIPATLIESEMFGHERGAFTGAVNARPGRFEVANRGTLFLDEVGELPLGLQTKFLRVLEERRFERVGGQKSIEVDVRVVAATNRDLAEMVRRGTFREDLYYRLSVIHIEVPPLRERLDDVPLLADHFLQRFRHQAARRVTGFSREALAVMTNYPWPGNVRELRNAVERAIVLGEREQIMAQDLPPQVLAQAAPPRARMSPPTPPLGSSISAAVPTIVETPPFAPAPPAPAPAPAARPSEPPSRARSLRELEKEGILAALAATGGNKAQAAAILEIDRSTLYKKLKDYDIES